MGAYRYLIGDLVPTSGNGIRAELPLSKVAFSHQLNGPGGFSATMGMRHPKAIRSDIDPARTAIHIERHGVIVWSGILWIAKAEVESAELQLGGQGWWSYFKGPGNNTGRNIRTDQVFAAVDQLEIARTLIDLAQSEAGGDLGIVVGTETSGVLRDRTYPANERKNIGAAIEDLSAVENGFDFAVDVAYDADLITKTFRPAYPRRGRETALRWELGVNLKSFGQQVDAGRLANRVDAIGADTLISTATAPLAGYPLLDGTVTYKDVSVPATLDGHAASALDNASAPVELLTVGLLTNDPNTELGGWITGDTVTVAGSDGWVEVPARPMRIMGYSVTVDENGAETVTASIADEAHTLS